MNHLICSNSSLFFFFFEKLMRDLQLKKHQIITRQNDDQIKMILKEILDFDWISELFWFKQNLPFLGSRLVFSHNDITKRNILVRTDIDQPVEQKIVLIDFADCSYNYRGFDLADFLRCRVSIMRVMKDGENIEFYSDEKIAQFCVWYLNEFKIVSKSFDPNQDNPHQLLKEVYYFLLLSDLLTILYITLTTEKSRSSKANWVTRFCSLLRHCQSSISRMQKQIDQFSRDLFSRDLFSLFVLSLKSLVSIFFLKLETFLYFLEQF